MNNHATHVPPAVSRLELVWVTAVTVAGLVLRLLLWSTQSMVSVDGTVYIRLARALAGGPSLESVQPPGYPILIRLFQLPLGDWVLAARAVDLVAGVALIPLVWLLARSYVSRGWLRLGPAVAAAALPLTAHYSVTTMSEAPYLALLLLAFVFRSRQRFFAAGILAGAAYLVRPEALVAAGALALFGIRRPRRVVRLVAGLALVVVPFVVIQGVQSGDWSLSAKTINIGGDQWWENEPAAGGDDLPATTGERVEAHWRESLGAYPARLGVLAEQVVRHGGWIVPVLALGALAGSAAALGAGLVQLLVTPMFALGGHARFALPFLPFLWILAAVFLDRLRPRWGLALGGLAVVGLAASAWLEAPTYHRNEDGVFPELLEAGQWLRPHVGPETVVYGRKPYVAFYAGAAYRAIPQGGYDAILDAIVRDKGDFLVVDQAVVDFFRPQLLPLAMDKPVVWNESRLAPVYVNRTYLGRQTVVYRVVRPDGPEPLPSEREIKKDVGFIEHGPDHYLHGLLAMRRERWEMAAGEFAWVAQADSTNADALNNRAWCLLQANRYLNLAETDARGAVKLAPDNVDFLDTLVGVLTARGRTEEAAFYRTRMDSLSAAGSHGETTPEE